MSGRRWTCRLSTLACLVVLSLPACSKPSSGTSDSGAPAAAPAGPGAVGLEDGTTLKLPEGATLVRVVQPPPPSLLSSRIYRVPSIDAALAVNVVKPTGKDCEGLLGDSLLQTNAQRTDPKTQGTVRVDVAEKRMLGSLKALYTEIGSRSPEDQQANLPYHAAASYLVCTKTSAVSLTMTVFHGDLTTRARVVLDQAATSLTY